MGGSRKSGRGQLTDWVADLVPRSTSCMGICYDVMRSVSMGVDWNFICAMTPLCYEKTAAISDFEPSEAW